MKSPQMSGANLKTCFHLILREKKTYLIGILRKKNTFFYCLAFRKCYSGCEEVFSLNNWNKSFLQKSSVAKQRELYKLFSSQVNNDVYSPVIKERDLDTYFVCNTRGFNISPGSAWIEYFCNYQVTKTGIFGFCCNWKLSPFVCLI